MTDGQRLYWLDDFADELMPCDGTLEGWAEWIVTADHCDGWHRTCAAQDGEVFMAHAATRTNHTVTIAGGVMSFTPDLPADWEALAAELSLIPGVVEHGLFLGMIDEMVFG